jgi:hypothetical protein
MTLRDDLLNYMARHGRGAIDLDRPEVVMVGEFHAHLRSNDTAVRATATTRLVRELLADQRFRYFGNEWFQNAGPIRHAIRDYWSRAALGPTFNPASPVDDAMDDEHVGARVTPRLFQPVLDDLRARPRYVLAIGARGLAARDRRLAQHFFEEIADRGIRRHTPGVLLLGAAHAAATPFDMGQTTMRMMLERQGYRCTSIYLMTDYAGGTRPDDEVYPLASGTPPGIRLGSLTLRSPISFNTRASADSPFFRVRGRHSDSGQSMAEQFEFIVLQRG